MDEDLSVGTLRGEPAADACSILLDGFIVRRKEEIGCNWKVLVCGELGAEGLDGGKTSY
jgi:hypothetical protein